MLIACPECKKEVSSTAKICPQCGFNIYVSMANERIRENNAKWREYCEKHPVHFILFILFIVIGTWCFFEFFEFLKPLLLGRSPFLK